MGRAFALLNTHMSESYLSDELKRCYDIKENDRGLHLRKMFEGDQNAREDACTQTM